MGQDKRATGHFSTRMLNRYGIHVTDIDCARLVRECQRAVQHGGPNVVPQGDGRFVVVLEFGREVGSVPVVFKPSAGQLVTALPRAWLVNYEKTRDRLVKQ